MRSLSKVSLKASVLRMIFAYVVYMEKWPRHLGCLNIWGVVSGSYAVFNYEMVCSLSLLVVQKMR